MSESVGEEVYSNPANSNEKANTSPNSNRVDRSFSKSA